MAPSGGQIFNKCKWYHLVAKFGTNASGAIWWPNLELLQVEPPLAGEITQVKASIPWVRCASGNVWWFWWVRKGDGRVAGGSMDSVCHNLSEDIWVVWSKRSYSGEMVRSDPPHSASELMGTSTISFLALYLNIKDFS